ncbi:siphovirus Gp157 family protein [Staphylococcus epidermidis]|uniref:siphovirus Gp157 family protein n=1 Tax=Staphylococcus epidermidis TaxID=1282 RepID=UPI001F217D59|nr:siphovirus Gp157 family protein [Staphylococcus epidermidis]UJA41858.1 siphovirus Gp157 family protein [Staphylococcus epidermidis]
MSNIYQINDKFLSVLNMADEDVDPQVIQDTLDSIELELNEKVDNIVGLKRSVDSDVDAIDKELKRLQELKKSKVKFSDRLKGYLSDMLDQRQLDNYRTSKNYIHKRKNGASKDVVDESKIPKEYWVSQAPKLNSKMLTDDLKAGKEIPGAQLKQTVSLVVK